MTIYYKGNSEKILEQVPKVSEEWMQFQLNSAKKIMGYSKSGYQAVFRMIIANIPVFVVLRQKHGIVNYYGNDYYIFDKQKDAVTYYKINSY